MATRNNSTLKPEELQALMAASRPMLREIVDERFIRKDDGRYVFRAMRRTARSMAGTLDIDADPNTVAARSVQENRTVTFRLLRDSSS